MANFVIASMEVIQDTTLTKIFVGGLNYNTTDEKLKEFFLQFGGIREAVVIMDRLTGKSKGYGFVTMETVDSAERACKDPNPIIDGRKANVNLAYLGAKPRLNQAISPRFQPYLKLSQPATAATAPPVSTWYGSQMYPIQQLRAYTPAVLQPQLTPVYPGYLGLQLQSPYLQYGQAQTVVRGPDDQIQEAQ